VPQSQYDVIILGSSLASDLTATLLSKNGRKVLHFRDTEDDYPLWSTAPTELLNLLNLLNARACLKPARRFQVITPTNRIDLLTGTPLDEELRREFPHSHSGILRFLQQLERYGRRLLDITRRGLLPNPGFGARGTFEMRCLFKRIPWRILIRPLLPRLEQFSDPAVRQFLRSLFEGLALRSVDELTIGQAALIWFSSTSSMSFSRSGLKELLAHRFDQFHGRSESISTVQQVACRRHRLTGIELAEGKHCQARTYLIGSQHGLNLLPEQLRPASSPMFAPCSYITSPLGKAASPFLAPGVILGGESTVRLTFSKTAEDLFATVESLFSQDEELLRQSLASILPFADFAIEKRDGSPTDSPDNQQRVAASFPARCQPAKIRSHLYLCNGRALLPAFGSSGEFMVAQAFCRLLGTKNKD